MKIGTVLDKTQMMMTQHIGYAEDPENGVKYEMLSGFPAGQPIVRHPDGRQWTLGWNETVNLAVAAFNAGVSEYVGFCNDSPQFIFTGTLAQAEEKVREESEKYYQKVNGSFRSMDDYKARCFWRVEEVKRI